MKKILFFISIITIINTTAQSKTYFLSPSGNDSNSGLSIEKAWKTIDKINQFVFQAGDAILLESGGVWRGQLFPKGSGEEGKPIILASYGDGVKPVINIGDAEGAAIRLVNQSWWEIRNIEVTSGAKPKLGIGRQGIVALYEGNDSQTKHIIIEDCYIHDIWGQMGANSEYCGYNSAAIYVGRVLGGRSTRDGFYDDVLIRNNRIERVDKCGIVVFGGRKDVKVRNNYIENLGGDGIFVNGPLKGLIEYNIAKRTCMRSGDPDLEGGENFWPHTAAIWIQNTTETIMQYNEVYDTGRQPYNGDGEAYDFDFDCRNCVLQYNYSRNNNGFLLIMYNTYGNIVRYNISENDQSHLIQLQGNIEDGNLIHNNVFYVDYGTIDIDYFCGDDGSRDKNKLGANFQNNIFYANGQGRFRTVYSSGSVYDRQYNDSLKLPPPAAGTSFYHNCYYGTWLNGLPYDPEKIVADPMFVAPGTGGEGLSTLRGYKLKTGSPCINTGRLIALNTDCDFYGNPINDGSPDYGIYEQIGSGAFADPLKQEKADREAKAEMDLLFAKLSFPEKLVFPQEGGKIVISLSEPLPENISGTVTITSGENTDKQTITIGNNTEDNIVFQAKSVKKLFPRPNLLVKMEKDDLKKEWEIPVYYSGKMELKKLSNVTIDGDLSEWENIPSLDINNKEQVYNTSEEWHTINDGACSFKAAISGNNLAIAVNVTDRQVITDQLSTDNIQIVFRKTEPENFRMFRGGRILLPARPENGKIENATLTIGRNSASLGEETQTFYKKTATGYIIELLIPFQSLGFESVPEKKSKLGMEIFLNNTLVKNGTNYQIKMSATGSPDNSVFTSVCNQFYIND